MSLLFCYYDYYAYYYYYYFFIIIIIIIGKILAYREDILAKSTCRHRHFTLISSPQLYWVTLVAGAFSHYFTNPVLSVTLYSVFVKPLSCNKFLLLLYFYFSQLSKKDYVELWLKGFHLHNGVKGTSLSELPSSHIQIVYSDSNSSGREEFVSSCDSRGDEPQMDITDPPRSRNIDEGSEEGLQPHSTELYQNFPFSSNTVTNLENESSIFQEVDREVEEKGDVTSRTLRMTMPARTRQNVKATLAHAALSAVLEGDEMEVSPVSWFDEQPEESIHKLRKANSTGSLNDSLLHSNTDVIDGDSRLHMNNSQSHKNSIIRTLEIDSMRALGHNRSRSDQIGVPMSQEKTFVVKKPWKREKMQQKAISPASRLSTSLPVTSGT